MPAGYSGKPLSEKLGIKAGTQIHAVGAPQDYLDLLDPLPVDVKIKLHGDASELARCQPQASFMHCFVTTRSQLAAAAPLLAQCIAPGGMLWVSWPKQSAAKRLGMACHVTEETLRELLLPTGLVDVKVCAVSELWSGLKFLWRKQ